MNKVLLGVIVASLVLILAIGFTSAFGFGFGKANLGNLSDEDKAALNEKRDAIVAAVEANDYSAWKALVESEISEERFNQIVLQHEKMSQFHDLKEQLREAYESGDEEAVETIKAQLSEIGFENQGKGRGMGKGQGMHSFESRGAGGMPENCPFAN